jgi:serpin B
MVLLNAIYFNGIWSKKFNDNGTKLRNFRKIDGSNIEVPMMSKEDTLEYAFNDLFQAIRLPYGNKQYNMVVVLPSEGKSSKDVIDELNAENWNNWMKSFANEDHVVVQMPRFKFAFNLELKEALKKMGMEQAFSPALSDFSGISGDPDLFISSVIHKSYIDVNETGTEAAAVTAITFTTTSVGPEPVKKIYFIVDKPFVFAITEKDTGAILFIGEVRNPVYD